MPRPLRKLPSAAGSRNAPAKFATFAFSFPEFSLPLELTQFWGSIGASLTMFMALCLPWLVIKKMSLRGKTGPAFQAASKPIVSGFGELVAQIKPLNPLFEDLQIIISERNQAFADLQSTIGQAREAKEKAEEKDAEKEENLKGLRSERKNALRELEKEKEKVSKLEEDKKIEVDRLQEEASSRMTAWIEKEKKWEEERANDKKMHVGPLIASTRAEKWRGRAVRSGWMAWSRR